MSGKNNKLYGLFHSPAVNYLDTVKFFVSIALMRVKKENTTSKNDISASGKCVLDADMHSNGSSTDFEKMWTLVSKHFQKCMLASKCSRRERYALKRPGKAEYGSVTLERIRPLRWRYGRL